MSSSGTSSSTMNLPLKDSSSVDGMSDMMLPAVWSPDYAALVLLMWWVMMIAMMLPSVAPINILYSTLIRQSNREQNPAILAATFLVGYLAAWVFFSLIATVLQSLLELRGFVSPMQISLTIQLVGAGILICAGLYRLPQ